jgi:hypothetical protein
MFSLGASEGENARSSPSSGFGSFEKLGALETQRHRRRVRGYGVGTRAAQRVVAVPTHDVHGRLFVLEFEAPREPAVQSPLNHAAPPSRRTRYLPPV